MIPDNKQCDAGDCDIARTLDVVGGKWTILIVRDLLEGPRRFGELERSLVGISPRTLACRLKELEEDGVLQRDCANFAHPIYRLTDKGRSLSGILDQMRAWGRATAESQATVEVMNRELT